MPFSLLYFYWDPNRVFFTVPFFNHPIMFYGAFFVLGFICAYLVVAYALAHKIKASQQRSKHPTTSVKSVWSIALRSTDTLCWLVILGTVIGARLAHVFFYDWPLYREHWLDIFKIWEGGLASHGAVVGIIVAIFFSVRFLRKDFPGINFLNVLDLVCLSAGIAAFWIRVGNFFNQEVIGIPTTVPWAIIFGHPMDHSAVVPRHPSQLYEALIYFAIFIFLVSLWKYREGDLRAGVISGLFFIMTFTARFFLDFLKLPQSAIIDESVIQMGQWLSVPCILLGIYLLWQGCRKPPRQKKI